MTYIDWLEFFVYVLIGSVVIAAAVWCVMMFINWKMEEDDE